MLCYLVPKLAFIQRAEAYRDSAHAKEIIAFGYPKGFTLLGKV
jgi:hypothetical protein